jgi:hypothetical protein
MSADLASVYAQLDSDAKAACVGAQKVTVCVMDLDSAQKFGVVV